MPTLIVKLDIFNVLWRTAEDGSIQPKASSVMVRHGITRLPEGSSSGCLHLVLGMGMLCTFGACDMYHDDWTGDGCRVQ